MNTWKPNDKQIDDLKRRDFQRACVHEAAHVVVARFFKDDTAHWEVIPNDEGNPLTDKLFVGRSRTGIDHPYKRKMVALAGFIAELLFEDEYDVADILETYDLDPDIMGPTDRRQAGGFVDYDVANCLRLVRMLWPEILRESKDPQHGTVLT